MNGAAELEVGGHRSREEDPVRDQAELVAGLTKG
jgi:hypothetical protein